MGSQERVVEPDGVSKVLEVAEVEEVEEESDRYFDLYPEANEQFLSKLGFISNTQGEEEEEVVEEEEEDGLAKWLQTGLLTNFQVGSGLLILKL